MTLLIAKCKGGRLKFHSFGAGEFQLTGLKLGLQSGSWEPHACVTRGSILMCLSDNKIT